MRFLFASRKDMVRRCIKAILSQEKKDISSGKLAKPNTDEELSHKVNEEHGPLVTRREVGYCRKELGILPYFERNGYVHHTLAANFSQVYPFTASSVESNAPAGAGVYELCLDSGVLEYPTGCCQTFYIGSAKNFRKRLLSHLGSSSKSGGIKKFIEEKSCIFRYLRIARRWAHEEKRFLQPLCLNIWRFSSMQSHKSEGDRQINRPRSSVEGLSRVRGTCDG